MTNMYTTAFYWRVIRIHRWQYAFILRFKEEWNSTKFEASCNYFDELQQGSHNTNLPCHKIKTGSRNGNTACRVGNVNNIDSNSLSSTMVLKESNVLSILFHRHADMAPVAAACSTIDLAPIISDMHRRCTILPFLFGKKSSHYALARHSVGTPLDSYQHVQIQLNVDCETCSMVPIEFGTGAIHRRNKDQPWRCCDQ